MEPEQNETGNQGQSQQQQQLNQLLSDGSFCGEAADSHAGENDNTSRTPSPVHRIIDEDSYFSDMIQGQGKNNGGGSKVMPLPTKTQPPNGCGGSAGLPQEDGFQKLPLEVPAQLFDSEGRVTRSTPSVDLPKVHMDMRHLSGDLAPTEINELVAEERHQADVLRHEEIKRKFLLEKELEGKGSSRSSITARRGTTFIANFNVPTLRKPFGFSPTVVPHGEVEENLLESEEGEGASKVSPSEGTSNEPAADLGAQRHHVEVSGSINAMLQEGQKDSRKKWVIYPNSTFRLSWDLTILMLTMYYTFMIPYRLAFIETIEPYSALNIIEQTFNAFFYIDLVINFCTAVQEGPVLKETHSEIAVSYLQSWFIIDLISCFPFDELAPEAEGADGSSLVKSFKLIRLIKTLRIIRATRALKKVLDVIQLNPSKIRLVKLTGTLLVVLHWMACSYWFISTFSERPEAFQREQAPGVDAEAEDAVNFWVPPDEMLETGQGHGGQYLYSFFWAIMVVTGIGRDVQPVSVLEHVFSIVMIFIGVLMYSVIIGLATSAFSNLEASNAERRQKLEAINQYMRVKRVPNPLQTRVREYYLYMWSSHQSLNEEGGIMSDLHDSLRLELHISLNRKLIENVPMFKMIKDHNCLIDLIEKLKPKIFIPGEYIVLEGEIGAEMYVVVRGTVTVMIGKGHNREEVATLKDGDVFGEHALITREKRNASVRSKTYCDLLVLSKIDFDEVMVQYPDFFNSLQKIAARKTDGGWERIRETMKMVRTIRIFGGEANMEQILLKKDMNTHNGDVMSLTHDGKTVIRRALKDVTGKFKRSFIHH